MQEVNRLDRVPAVAGLLTQDESVHAVARGEGDVRQLGAVDDSCGRVELEDLRRYGDGLALCARFAGDRRLHLRKPLRRQRDPEIAAAHQIPYVATACSSYPLDLYKKAKRAMDTPGPAYVHVLTVCPTGWRIPAEKAIEYGKLAVQTGVFPLYEVIDGDYHLSMKIKNRKPIEEYFKGHGRFRHLTPEQTKEIQTRVDKEWERLWKKCVNTEGGGV